MRPWVELEGIGQNGCSEESFAYIHPGVHCLPIFGRVRREAALPTTLLDPVGPRVRMTPWGADVDMAAEWRLANFAKQSGSASERCRQRVQSRMCNISRDS